MNYYHLFATIFTIIFLVGDNNAQFKLESPRVTNWGTWGAVHTCPVNHTVYGMRLKIQPYSGIWIDDTALNGIELLCSSNTSLRMRDDFKDTNKIQDFAAITSSVGHKGSWTPILECPVSTYATGFQLRSEKNQLLLDDTASNDLKLLCSDGSIIGGYNITDFGNWTAQQVCPRGLGICAIQTQVEAEGHDDETTLNNVDMTCCTI